MKKTNKKSEYYSIEGKTKTISEICYYAHFYHLAVLAVLGIEKISKVKLYLTRK